MWSREAPNKRAMLWATIGLTVAYALYFAVTLPTNTSDAQFFWDALFFWEGLFGGPMAIACILSIFLARVEARIILLGFAVGYSILTALIFYWTFGFEHDAQYQLMLFLIPILGFPSVAVLGLAAIMIR
jgi:peptidoglycan/LPS O-acetylase OafA/YrhL